MTNLLINRTILPHMKQDQVTARVNEWLAADWKAVAEKWVEEQTALGIDVSLLCSSASSHLQESDLHSSRQVLPVSVAPVSP